MSKLSAFKASKDIEKHRQNPICILFCSLNIQQQSQLTFAHEKLFRVSKCNADVDFLKILTVNVGTRQSLKAERY